jgi:hypothetical protein
MVVKYFSERVSPGINDKASKKEGFGFWKDRYFHIFFSGKENILKKEIEERLKRRLEEEARERKVIHIDS